MKTLLVTKIALGWSHKSEVIIHRIYFKEPDGSEYIGEEASKTRDYTPFRENTFCTFEITHPGKGGNKDWIKFLACTPVQADGSMQVGHIPPTRDKIEAARAGLFTATQIGTMYAWDEETIKDKAVAYAKLIFEIAQSL